MCFKRRRGTDQGQRQDKRYEYDRLEQYTRRENVRIHKWTVDDSSPLTPQVLELLNHMAELGTKDGEDPIQFRESDISTCHGVGVGAKKQTIVRFVSRAKVRDVFKMKKNLKDSVKFKGTFITEDMTALRMKLLQVVKDDKETSDAYTINGNVHVTYRKKKVVIASPDDLFKINIDPDMEALGLKSFA